MRQVVTVNAAAAAAAAFGRVPDITHAHRKHMIIFYSPASGRETNIKHTIKHKNNNLTNKKHTLVRLITVTTYRIITYVGL